MKEASISYRPDIDGLRAIAVLAVIAFHANAAILPGGFVGVDIFFVISGYLITGLIWKGIEQNDFSFAGFYTRRIKRLFPAYIVVSVVTFAVSSYLLIPNDYIFFTTSLAASWGFLSNVFFSMLSWGYFGQRTEEFPLLHTWSLSVEEQFYFVFPVLLIFLNRYLRRYAFQALIVLGAAFALFSQYKAGEIKSYFLLTSRAHELIIGALTFFVAQRGVQASRSFAGPLAALGLAMMIGSLFLIDRSTVFPGFASLFPCIGAALLIYAGQTRNVVSSALANDAMVRIGLISYSLYLWHWPIFTFLRYRKIALTLPVGLFAVALAFFLAYLTWKFVETPVRRSKEIRFKKAFVQMYALPAAAFLSIGIYSYLTEGAPDRFSGDMRELISSYSYERDLTRSCSIRDEDYRKVNVDYLSSHCAFGDEKQARAQVLLIGDSHAGHFKPFVEELAEDAKLKAVFHVQGNCRPTSLAAEEEEFASEVPTCKRRNADLLALAKNFKYVILAGFWSDYADADLEAEFLSTVEKIEKSGATPIIFKDNASHEPDLSQCILHKKRGWIDQNMNCNIPYRQLAGKQTLVDAVIDRVKAKNPHVRVVDPKQIMCDANECVTYISNVALYKDSNHINSKASSMLGEFYLSRFGNPLRDAELAVAAKPVPGGALVRHR